MCVIVQCTKLNHAAHSRTRVVHDSCNTRTRNELYFNCRWHITRLNSVVYLRYIMKRSREDDEVRGARRRCVDCVLGIRDLAALLRRNASDDVVEGRVWTSVHVSLSCLSIYRVHHARGCEWCSCNTPWRRMNDCV